MQLAFSPGATVVTRESEDVAGAICAFAMKARINVLVVGKPTRPAYLNRFAPSIGHKLLARGRGFDLVILDTEEEEE